MYRQNLLQLKTHTIDEKYKKNRKTDYHELFKSAYFIRVFLSNKKHWFAKENPFFSS